MSKPKFKSEADAYQAGYMEAWREMRVAYAARLLSRYPPEYIAKAEKALAEMEAQGRQSEVRNEPRM